MPIKEELNVFAACTYHVLPKFRVLISNSPTSKSLKISKNAFVVFFAPLPCSANHSFRDGLSKGSCYTFGCFPWTKAGNNPHVVTGPCLLKCQFLGTVVQ